MKVIILADQKSLKKLPDTQKNLLQGCWEIFSEYTDERNLRIQCPADQRDPIHQSVPNASVFTEPEKRGTAPAIGLAATRIFQNNPEETIVLAYSDHPVSYKDNLISTLKTAQNLHESLDQLILIGVNPTFPSTNYGYIKIGKVLQETNGLIAFEMVGFNEKPKLETASKFLQSWRYLWNTGYAMVKARTLLDLYQEFLPEMHQGLMTIKEALDTDLEKDIIKTVYPNFAKTSIDEGIYEKISRDRISVVPVDLDIHDLEI